LAMMSNPRNCLAKGGERWRIASPALASSTWKPKVGPAVGLFHLIPPNLTYGAVYFWAAGGTSWTQDNPRYVKDGS
jgi:hypothetical protein